MSPRNQEEQMELQDTAKFGDTIVKGHASAILGTVNIAVHYHEFPAGGEHGSNLAAVFAVARHILQYVDTSSRLLAFISTLHQYGFETTSSRKCTSRSAVFPPKPSAKLKEDMTDYDILEEDMGRLNVIASCLYAAAADGARSGHFQQLASHCYEIFPTLCHIARCAQQTRSYQCKEATKAAFQLVCTMTDITSLRDQLAAVRRQFLDHLLNALGAHVSNPVKQQQTTLNALGIEHDPSVELKGMAASVLRYLTSGEPARKSRPVDTVRAEKEERKKEAKDLNHDLIHAFYVRAAGLNPTSPTTIHVAPDDRKRAEALFLRSIKYDGMQDREHRVAKAHETTFRWVLNEASTAKRSGLCTWLVSSDQLFWITGKAGSGKSTLMKFLSSPKDESLYQLSEREQTTGHCTVEQSRCHLLLKRWAGDSQLIVASFYFWNSGMELQTTQAGLLRTLLFQIVMQCPDIVPKIATKHWESMCLFDDLLTSWTTQQLRDTLLQAVRVLKEDSKMCFFIDGLDEFGNNHDELISLVKELIDGHSHVKICVASRPWTIFQDAFDCHPNLRLEELTFDDIQAYVRSRFQSNKEFDALRKRYHGYADHLMTQIVTKALGVFLWVDLVVSSLLAGMRYGDRIQDFQRRLDELPPDLEDLYEKILQSLDPFYLSHAVQYFALVETAPTPLTVLQFSFADEETMESTLAMTPGFMKDEDLAPRIDAMERRLNNRCRGLLETERISLSLDTHNPRTAARLTVQYLHRTVRDFIKSPKAQDFLRSSSYPSFDPSLQLCIASIMHLKAWTGVFGDDSTPKPCDVLDCLRYAACVSTANHRNVVVLMDELKGWIIDFEYPLALAASRPGLIRKHMALTPARLVPTWRGLGLSAKTGEAFTVDMDLTATTVGLFDLSVYLDYTTAFLVAAVMHNVVPYVKMRADWGGLVRRRDTNSQYPLLLIALGNNVPEPDMIDCLLGRGADPNYKISRIEAQTPWSFALIRVTTLYNIQLGASGDVDYQIAEAKWRRTLELMFLRGGDCTRLQEGTLSPISRDILHSLQQKHGNKTQWGKVQGSPSWRRSW